MPCPQVEAGPCVLSAASDVERAKRRSLSPHREKNSFSAVGLVNPEIAVAQQLAAVETRQQRVTVFGFNPLLVSRLFLRRNDQRINCERNLHRALKKLATHGLFKRIINFRFFGFLPSRREAPPSETPPGTHVRTCNAAFPPHTTQHEEGRIFFENVSSVVEPRITRLMKTSPLSPCVEKPSLPHSTPPTPSAPHARQPQRSTICFASHCFRHLRVLDWTSDYLVLWVPVRRCVPCSDRCPVFPPHSPARRTVARIDLQEYITPRGCLRW